jgi:group I intron endonuclease
MHYLYTITNGKNGKVYIGRTINPRIRWKQHKYDAKRARTGQYIHNAMKNHGIDQFTFQIVDFANNPWQADCIEKGLITRYDSRNRDRGYNLKSGGQMWGEEQRAKIAEWQKAHPNKGRFVKGHSNSPERNANHAVYMKAHPNKGTIKPKRYEYRIQRTINGRKVWGEKLTDQQLTAIRNDPRGSRVIATDYGCHYQTIQKIRRNR